MDAFEQANIFCIYDSFPLREESKVHSLYQIQKGVCDIKRKISY